MYSVMEQPKGKNTSVNCWTFTELLLRQVGLGHAHPKAHITQVGVGVMVAHNPLHRSGPSSFPDNALATQGIGMVGANEWQPAVDQPPHPVPKDASVLATPRKGAMPVP